LGNGSKARPVIVFMSGSEAEQPGKILSIFSKSSLICVLIMEGKKIPLH